MSVPLADSPSARAEDLLRRVLGPARYQALARQGYLELPSRVRRGRVYRLDSSGNLSYREPGQYGFHTSLCIQPVEPVPRADAVAARYLLLTTDEPALLATANPVRFSLAAITIAVYRDARERYGAAAGFLYTVGMLALFFGALGVEAAAVAGAFAPWPAAGLILCVLAAPPAVLGFVLLGAAAADGWSLLATACGRWCGVNMPPPQE